MALQNFVSVSKTVEVSCSNFRPKNLKNYYLSTLLALRLVQGQAITKTLRKVFVMIVLYIAKKFHI